MSIVNDNFYLSRALAVFHEEVKQSVKFGVDFVCVSDERIAKINRIFSFTCPRHNLLANEFVKVISRNYEFGRISVLNGDDSRHVFRGIVGYAKHDN